MTHPIAPQLSPRLRRFFLVGEVTLMTAASACTPAATQTSAPAEARPSAALPHLTGIPGVPDRPDLVTVVPFYQKENETDQEQTKVVIPAEVDGHRSIFIVDLGCPPLMLNRTFLQPSPTGGIDSVTDANRIPDHTVENRTSTYDKVHVTMRIGTLSVTFEDTTMHGPYNAYLGHEWGNFGWNFSPRLGNIGLSVLEQFEAIVDYNHSRLVLIRLDKAGHRMVPVPAYTPSWSAPLIDVALWPNFPAWKAWGIAVGPDHFLDTANVANNTVTRAIDTGSPGGNSELLGYPFLSGLGVVGFNHRARQFILYR